MWVPKLALAHTLLALTAPPPRTIARSQSQRCAAAEGGQPQHPTVHQSEIVGRLHGPAKGAESQGPGVRTCAGGRRRHAFRPNRDTPSTVLLIMLEAGHYYHVRISPQRADRRWDLEAIDSMIPVATSLPDGPTTLIPGHPVTL